MRIIYPDNISSISATNEDSDYPDDNLLDEHPRKMFMATGASSTITVNISSGDSLAIINTNANQVSATMVDGWEVDWYSGWAWDTGWEWNNPEQISLSSLALNESDGSNAYYISYDLVNNSHTISLDLTTLDTYLYVGVCTAGEAWTCDDPLVGMAEGLKDFSTVVQTNSGSRLIIDDFIVREYNFSVWMHRDSKWRDLVHNIYKANGSHPMAFYLCDGLCSGYQLVYGFIRAGTLVGTQNNPNYTMVNFEIEEAI